MSCFTPDRDAELCRLWADRANTVSAIGRLLARVGLKNGATPQDIPGSYVSIRARELNLPPRGMRGKRSPRNRRMLAPATLPNGTHPYFTNQALRRGLTTAELVERLLAVIAQDKMVDCVLDDVDELQMKETRVAS